MEWLRTSITFLTKFRYCFVSVSTEVRNVGLLGVYCSGKSSKKGLRIRLMVYHRGDQPVSVHVRACVCMCVYVCPPVCLSVCECVSVQHKVYIWHTLWNFNEKIVKVDFEEKYYKTNC